MKGGHPHMIKHLRDVRARRRGEELVESGFTLIELLVVIVVLGILAATVVFALSGVTGQSAAAACNSDAKTLDVAVQAYINSPNNTNNSQPTDVSQLQNPSFQSSGFITNVPNNAAYDVQLNGTGPRVAGAASDAVVVQVPKGTGTWEPYDTDNTCSQAS